MAEAVVHSKTVPVVWMHTLRLRVPSWLKDKVLCALVCLVISS